MSKNKKILLIFILLISTISSVFLIVSWRNDVSKCNSIVNEAKNLISLNQKVQTQIDKEAFSDSEKNRIEEIANFECGLDTLSKETQDFISEMTKKQENFENQVHKESISELVLSYSDLKSQTKNLPESFQLPAGAAKVLNEVEANFSAGTIKLIQDSQEMSELSDSLKEELNNKISTEKTRVLTSKIQTEKTKLTEDLNKFHFEAVKSQSDEVILKIKEAKNSTSLNSQEVQKINELQEKVLDLQTNLESNPQDSHLQYKNVASFSKELDEVLVQADSRIKSEQNARIQNQNSAPKVTFVNQKTEQKKENTSSSAKPITPAPKPKSILVDKSDRVLKVIQGDKVIKTYSAQIGSSVEPTPTGDFEILYKSPVHNLPLVNPKDWPMWMTFSGNYGIHNRPWRSSEEIPTWGCVSLSTSNMEDLYYNHSFVGMKVLIQE